MVPSEPALVAVEGGAGDGGGGGGGTRHLVVSDLHIGFEARLAANGVFVGKNSSVSETIAGICAMIRGEGARSLILLGDTKSGTGSITRAEWDDVPRFFEEVSRLAEIVLIPGNHDAGIDRLARGNVTLAGPSGIVIQNTLLTHGHAMPSENFAHVDGVIMGHIHPVYLDEGSVLNGRRVWVSARVKRQDVFPSASGGMDLLLVPSFNRYLYAERGRRGGGTRGSTSPIIRRITGFESARVVTLDGSIIGDAGALDRVI